MNLHLKRTEISRKDSLITLAEFVKNCPLKEAPDALSYYDNEGQPQVVHVFSDKKKRNYCLNLSDPVEIGIQPLDRVDAQPGSIEPLHLEMLAVSLDKAPQLTKGLAELMRKI